jgi:hypothetical protein
MAEEPVKRKYNITDTEMFEQSSLKRGFFLEDKTALVAFDSDFDDPFAADWLAKIEEAEALPSDEIIEDQLTQLTDDVDEQMDICRGKFQDSKYFIEKAFPGKPKIWNEFGFDNYRQVRNIQKDMVHFMDDFHNIAQKYKVPLIAAGYPQLTIDEIKTFRDNLHAANQAQEEFKKKQPVKTEERITVYNETWDFMVRVCSAGKIKFKSSYAKYQLYLLPPGEESPEAVSITGQVTDSVRGALLPGALLELTPADVSTSTAANGRYSFGVLPDGDYVLTISLAGYTTLNINITITGGNAVEQNVHLVHV